MKAAEASARVTLQNVLFLTDFSEPSEAALPFAIGIARAYGAKIFALHVLRPDPMLYSTPPSAAIAQQAQEESAEAEMQRVESVLAGLPHATFVEWGDGIWLRVEQALKDYAIDLIVLGTHGRTGAEKLLLGSVAEEIFRRSPVPVLTIGPLVRSRAHNGARFHNVLFATDFSSHSLVALPYALSLAQENQARLTLLHVVLANKPVDAVSVNETDTVSLISKLNKLVPEEARLWCQPESFVEKGRPATQLLETAKRRGADLIVLGIRNGSQHLGSATHLSGATAHKVVAHAECPVLTVRE
jgi:nucleotide-binding universal stress UspA family protein